jgi:acylaminoacyl-peptidase
VPRPPRPADLYRLRIPTEPVFSPDGRWVVVTLQSVAPGFDGYRHALWLVPTDPAAGGEPRRLTLGARHDRHARFSPDGRTLAFLSDRRSYVEEEPKRSREGAEREDTTQVHLLPFDSTGGEARRLTDLPRGVDAFEWSPDGRRLVVVSASTSATYEEDARRRGRDDRREPGEPPPSDLRFIDRLEYMLNGAGFTYDRVTQLWLVDAATGAASPLTQGQIAVEEPSWSPDGTRIAFSSNRGRYHDLAYRQSISVVDVASRRVTAITGGPRAVFGAPTFMPDGESIAALGHRLANRGGSRFDLWLLAADGSDASATGGRNLSARHDLMPGAGMASDVTPGENVRLWPSPDGRTITFTAPIDGSYEVWRIRTGDGQLERLTTGRHHISGWDATAGPRGRARLAYLRSSPTEPADLWLLDRAAEPRRLTSFNADVLGELTLREAVERHVTVDGWDIPGWLIPAGEGARPTLTQIHGGPHTLYGWSPFWEFQVLAANGISVFYSNPRGSEGYGQDFNDANHRDWGPGPMRDVIAGVDALVDDGLADRDRLGLTGGSYGGYLTNWMSPMTIDSGRR